MYHTLLRMNVIVTIFIFGFFQKSLAVPFNCTKDDLCRPVPAKICDNSLCQPFDAKDWADLGQAGLKAYTWTIAQKSFIRYCPLTFNFEMSKGNDYQTLHAATIQLKSGPYCNITTATTSLTFIPDEFDQYTRKIKTFKEPQAGDMYNACLLYLEPGVGFVYRTCRVNPPPPYGEGCASLYVYENASGNCNRTNLMKFIQGLGIDFTQDIVDCL